MPEGVLSPSSVVIQNQSTGQVLGSQTGFMVNVDRRKLPILTLGNVDPVGFGRGFRIISGVIDYVILNKDLFLEILYDMNDGSAIGTQSDKKPSEIIVTKQEYDVYNAMENKLTGETNDTSDTTYKLGGVEMFKKIFPTTLDMLPPIDYLVYGIDTNGNVTGMLIKKMEFTSTSYAVTVNDVAIAQRAEWVAEQITPWQ